MPSRRRRASTSWRHHDAPALARAIAESEPVARAAAAPDGPRIETDGASWPQLADDLLSKFVEPGLMQPTLVLDYPIELSPFARPHRSLPGLAERWEAFAGGMEIANAFSELNDPDIQRQRFEAQRRLAEAGDEETQPWDELFLEALEHGMPPTGGVGLGIDRWSCCSPGARASARSCCSRPCAADGPRRVCAWRPSWAGRPAVRAPGEPPGSPPGSPPATEAHPGPWGPW